MPAKGKLFIQIPCLNEQATIAGVIKNIPRKELEKIGLKVKVLVIDDGSEDLTSKVAKKSGADFILRHNKTLGLAKSFSQGVEFCLNKKAQIIVNTDGDNQYDQKEILNLIKPIISGKADMVIGDRQVSKLKFMPLSKKLGNQVGSWFIRLLTGNRIPDASSGFRAFSRALAKHLFILSEHTYTHEMIIQSSNNGFSISSTPVTFRNRADGDSRLISKGIYDHIKKSLATIIRSVLLYKALKYLFFLGSVIILIGIMIGIRFVYFFIGGNGAGHIQSLILFAVLMILGFMVIILGFISDLISVNRKILEKIKSRTTREL